MQTHLHPSFLFQPWLDLRVWDALDSNGLFGWPLSWLESKVYFFYSCLTTKSVQRFWPAYGFFWWDIRIQVNRHMSAERNMTRTCTPIVLFPKTSKTTIDFDHRIQTPNMKRDWIWAVTCVSQNLGYNKNPCQLAADCIYHVLWHVSNLI